MRKVAVAGLAAQLGLLGLLSAVGGLSRVGWLIGVAFGTATLALLLRALARTAAAAVGPANTVTLVRSAMVGGVAAVVTTGFSRPIATTLVVPLAAVAIALDGVDGWVARRTDSATAVGARFDMEVDAFLILVLSVHAARVLSPWVALIGAMRYLFLAAGALLPWLRDPLPPRYWRKVVAVVQGVSLTTVASDVLPRTWAAALSLGALGLLLESFGHDVWWLMTRRATAAGRRVPSRLRTVGSRIAAVVAPTLLWAALVAPSHLGDLTLSTFLRVPVEGLALLAIGISLPPWPRHLFSVVVGTAVAGLVLIKTLDVGFFAVLDRPFNPATDWANLGPAVGVLRDAIGRGKTVLLLVAVSSLLATMLATMIAAALRVTRVAARHRVASYQVIGGLGMVAVLCAGLGVTTSRGAPVASTSSAGLVTDEVHLVEAGLQDRHTFQAQLSAIDRFAITPGSLLLTGLRGKDVLLVFVESYGRVAVEGSAFSPQVDAVLTKGTQDLRAAGWSSRSAFLTSPTFGGVSWLAHSTLQSGLWVDGPGRYSQITASGRFTLSEAFHRAGWRTVFDIPSSHRPWQEGQHLYHFDTMYGAEDVGYAGPKFSYAKIPDQYTLAALYQHELAPAPRKPVMAEIDLVSSHTPWGPLPHMVPWADLGNGAIYDPMPGQGRRPALRNPADVQAAYAQSIRYSLTALISFLQTYHDDNLVLVVLGDHQPSTIVSGENAGHDVPVTVIAHDSDVIGRIGAWRWDDGLLPGPRAPVWRMDTFRDRFLTAYGPSSSSMVRADTPER